MTRTQATILRRLKAAFTGFQREVQAVLAELEHANNVTTVELPEVRRCMELTCQHYGVGLEQLLQRNRVAHVAWARQVAIYLAMTTTRYKDIQVGTAFLRERSNVRHAVTAVRNRMATDKKAKADIEALLAKL